MTDQPVVLDPNNRAARYFRNAVERHWDPYAIPLDADIVRVPDLEQSSFDGLRRTLALFGAGEESVAEDLAPLAVVLDDIEDEMFVTSQLYEESKHAEFFDRYWREVIHPAEDQRGEDRTLPHDDRWFSDAYNELFERNHDALHRLLREDTPETRASAYCHYHLVIEGVLAQTGYFGVQNNFSGEVEELPRLPGLVEGFTRIRSDEGRHVGFGMAKLKDLVESGQVTPDYLHEVVNELLALTNQIVSASVDEDAAGLPQERLVGYAAERHTDRMQQIVDASQSIPDVDELVELKGD